ncbi:MAG: recombinase family protein [Planctomycetota bacterium]
MTRLRCAIYTRKSHEEGLDQAFNSLDAQRQAGLDYIQSQKHEGWQAVKDCYDDGGYSGGTMKRPALERLLADIDRGRVDVVVVYKVDRLSRSLHDFARMMQRFDDKHVSFVSVTQQFNTTTSMGRLTLNMLLSFAQFEREVTGERIRDKIAATKKQGYWVCGQPPLGYRRQREDEPRGLYVVEDEASLVRLMFDALIETRSLVKVAEQLNRDGHTTRRWTSSKGRVHGAKPLTQKYVYRVLTNLAYIGKITRTQSGKTEVFDGLHASLIDQSTWDQVQGLIQAHDRDRRYRWTHSHLLKGKLRTADGAAMSPTSTHRPAPTSGSSPNSKKRKRLVRYYVSQQAIKHGFASCPIKSVNAEHLDDLVRAAVLDHLDRPDLASQPQITRDHWISEAIARVELSPDWLRIELDPQACQRLAEHELDEVADPEPRPTCAYQPTVHRRSDRTTLDLNIQIKRHDGRRIILAPDGNDLVIPSQPEPKPHIVQAIGQAYAWHEELKSSAITVNQLAERESITSPYVHKMLRLTLLGPPVLEAALVGSLPPRTNLDDLLNATGQLDWGLQASQLGLTSNQPS